MATKTMIVIATIPEEQFESLSNIVRWANPNPTREGSQWGGCRETGYWL